jgi:dipeptidyl aminopeptidase/acylaminoacyl peptidase
MSCCNGERVRPAALPWIAGLAWTLLGVGSAGAAEPARTHDIELEDYFTLGVVQEVAASPDNAHVAYTELRWEPPQEKRNTDLWVVTIRTKAIQRLTFDPGADDHPVWSPDSSYVYFTGSRKQGDGKTAPYNGKKQVWRISPQGGEPFPVTRLADGVALFDLSADGKTLYYTVEKEHVEEAWKDLKTKYKDLNYAHGVLKVGEVWKLDLTTWRAEKLIDDQRVIRSLAVAPDEQHIAMITTPDETLLTNEGWSRVDIWHAETKSITPLPDRPWRSDAPSPYGWIDDVDWSADSRALALSVSWDGYPAELYVAEWGSMGVRTWKLDRPEDAHVVGGSLMWRSKSRELCFIAESRARSRVYGILEVRDGNQRDTRAMTPGDVAVTALHFASSGGGLAAVVGTTTQTGDVFLVPDAGAWNRLTNVNPQVDNWKLPSITLVTWKGAGDTEVEGILELPPDYRPGTPLPMIVELHGGPTACTLYRLRFWIYGRTLLAAKGYALLSPNYRGSTGYGDQFMTDLIGRENNIEVEDILRGVDAMIERGVADPHRLGVVGWSNGGFLTNCLITSSNRFQAASSGAGVLDMVIQWGLEDTPGHVINYMGGRLPWEEADLYRHSSPLFKLGAVTTPTLIHVGGDDPRCPKGHSEALYRALRHYVKVPTELVVYPGEGHGLTTYTNRKAKMEWDLAWFEKYVRPVEDPFSTSERRN